MNFMLNHPMIGICDDVIFNNWFNSAVKMLFELYLYNFVLNDTSLPNLFHVILWEDVLLFFYILKAKKCDQKNL